MDRLSQKLIAIVSWSLRLFVDIYRKPSITGSSQCKKIKSQQSTWGPNNHGLKVILRPTNRLRTRQIKIILQFGSYYIPILIIYMLKSIMTSHAFFVYLSQDQMHFVQTHQFIVTINVTLLLSNHIYPHNDKLYVLARFLAMNWLEARSFTVRVTWILLHEFHINITLQRTCV